MGGEAKQIEDPKKEKDVKTVGKPFIILASASQLVLLILYMVMTDATNMDVYTDRAQNIQLYNNFVGITLMMFVGFGYLMTFLRKYGLSALGFTMFITCLGMQWSMLCVHIFHHIDHFSNMKVNVMALLEGDFAVAAFLISFGGIIGKASPLQLLIMVLCESVFYSANTKVILGTHWLDITDVGGTIIIHMFGAYFGLAVAWVLGKPNSEKKEGPSPTSDIFAFIGTLFLWIYWPTFVSGWRPAGTIEADTCITNTVMSLLGSSVCTFIFSAALNGWVFRPVDIQNATLAGGVTIGSLANLNIGPGWALLTGCGAGVISSLGFWKVQDFLKEKIGLHDTCGINNLHGMPSLLGGLLSVVMPAIVKAKVMDPQQDDWTGEGGDAVNQLLGVVMTLVVSISTGLATGYCMKMAGNDAECFEDEHYWEVAEVAEEPQEQVNV